MHGKQSAHRVIAPDSKSEIKTHLTLSISTGFPQPAHDLSGTPAPSDNAVCPDAFAKVYLQNTQGEGAILAIGCQPGQHLPPRRLFVTSIKIQVLISPLIKLF